MIKEAGRLLYCDGLASLKMVWGGGEVGGGRRKLFEPHSLCSYQASQSAEALLLCVNGQVGCMSPCLHPCLDPPPCVVTDLLSFHCGVCVSDFSSVYEHIAQPGMQGPVQIRFHN